MKRDNKKVNWVRKAGVNEQTEDYEEAQADKEKNNSKSK